MPNGPTKADQEVFTIDQSHRLIRIKYFFDISQLLVILSHKHDLNKTLLFSLAVVGRILETECLPSDVETTNLDYYPDHFIQLSQYIQSANQTKSVFQFYEPRSCLLEQFVRSQERPFIVFNIPSATSIYR